MAADPNRVVVASGHPPQFHANHHDFPELRADGESPAIAAFNLAQDLEREIDAAADDLHREPLRGALADVQAFLANGR